MRIVQQLSEFFDNLEKYFHFGKKSTCKGTINCFKFVVFLCIFLNYVI